MDIERYLAMCEAATPGPWMNGGCVVWQTDGDAICDLCNVSGRPSFRDPDETMANATLITEAREALPKLANQVQNLKAQVDALREALESIENDDGRTPAAIWKMRNDALAMSAPESEGE